MSTAASKLRTRKKFASTDFLKACVDQVNKQYEEKSLTLKDREMEVLKRMALVEKRKSEQRKNDAKERRKQKLNQIKDKLKQKKGGGSSAHTDKDISGEKAKKEFSSTGAMGKKKGGKKRVSFA